MSNLVFALCLSGQLVSPPQRQAWESAPPRRATLSQAAQAQRPQAAPIPRGPSSPLVVETTFAGPDLLCIAIQSRKVVPSKLGPYRAEPGDEKVPQQDGKQLILRRGSADVGWLLGPKRDQLATFEGFTGDELQGEYASWVGTYTVNGEHPVAVYRKSKPNDWAQPYLGFPILHRIYLRLAKPFQPGQRVTVDLGDLNASPKTQVVTYDPKSAWSEAVHVSQIGYRPEDPAKRAYLSLWLGTGGALSFPKDLSFEIADAKSGATVFAGTVEKAMAAHETEPALRRENISKTDIYRMDFSALKRPGRYRVRVDGVGCSYPFEIGGDVWKKAFRIQMKGLYNQRSGVDLGPPYTTFRKPADFLPGKNATVTQTTWSVLRKNEAWDDLPKADTGVPVPEAWGGYMDAGDWNPRRVTHMRVTMAQLELLDLFPSTFEKMSLNIPPAGSPGAGWEPSPGGSRKPIPDLLNEALFEIDLFRRLQKPDGGVPFGIETAGDPIHGEVSWLQSMRAYVYAPDPFSSWYYASVAARASRILARYDAKLSERYRQSALRAMLWAEARRSDPKIHWEGRDSRNLAALEMCRLTGDKAWLGVFMENFALKDPNGQLYAWGDHTQREAAFGYTFLDDAVADPVIKARAKKATLAEADRSLAFAAGNGLGITSSEVGRPMSWGFFGVPDAMQLCRAHYFTHDAKYLAGAVQACAFASGANPNNLCYTTGLGANPILHPLKVDARHSGQPAPVGLTVFGNYDYAGIKEPKDTVWPITNHLWKECVPSGWDWPVSEGYWDIYLFPAINEYVVDAWAPNVYVWGYLTARK